MPIVKSKHILHFIIDSKLKQHSFGMTKSSATLHSIIFMFTFFFSTYLCLYFFFLNTFFHPSSSFIHKQWKRKKISLMCDILHEFIGTGWNDPKKWLIVWVKYNQTKNDSTYIISSNELTLSHCRYQSYRFSICVTPKQIVVLFFTLFFIVFPLQ